MIELHAEHLGNQSTFKTCQVLNDEPTPIKISAVVDNAYGLRELIRRLVDYANMLELDERKRRAFAAPWFADPDEA
jgi:hypothetical protein